MRDTAGSAAARLCRPAGGVGRAIPAAPMDGNPTRVFAFFNGFSKRREPKGPKPLRWLQVPERNIIRLVETRYWTCRTDPFASRSLPTNCPVVLNAPKNLKFFGLPDYICRTARAAAPSRRPCYPHPRPPPPDGGQATPTRVYFQCPENIESLKSGWY
jgi:hypothetical protein